LFKDTHLGNSKEENIEPHYWITKGWGHFLRFKYAEYKNDADFRLDVPGETSQPENLFSRLTSLKILKKNYDLTINQSIKWKLEVSDKYRAENIVTSDIDSSIGQFHLRSK
jgi:hypothetical protein